MKYPQMWNCLSIKLEEGKGVREGESEGGSEKFITFQNAHSQSQAATV